MRTIANGAYAKGLRHLLTDVSWETAVLKAVAVNIAAGHYTVDLAVHEFLADVASGDRIDTSAALAGAAVLDDGVLDADNSVLTTVTAGVGVNGGAVVIYAEIGGDSTSVLLLYLDDMSGLPFTPNGSDMDLLWNDGVDKIARV